MFVIIAAVFRHLYDAEDSISTVQTLQDYGSSIPFVSQCGQSPCGQLQDPSSGIMHTITMEDVDVHGL